MGHGHRHAPASATAHHRHRLAAALAVVLCLAAVEVVGALLTGSLALLSDAGHLLTDVLGIGLALAAARAALRGPPSAQHSFGAHRLEILAALVNAILLVGLSGYVLVEAARRLADPPEVAAGPMLAVAVAGLAASLVAFLFLRGGAGESLNVRGAYLEVLADMVSSAGVVLAAIVLLVTGWPYVDALVAAAVGLWLLPRAVWLGRAAVRVLLQAAPPHVDLGEVEHALEELDGVTGVHDVHVWTLTSGMEVATAHLDICADAHGGDVLERASVLLDERFGVTHATLQLERRTDGRRCRTPSW